MKMHFKHIAFIFSTYISCINCAVHFERIYGVADEDLGKYQRTPDNLFHCLDGNGVIPYSSLNDDYCDCADGSDEPGTPACPNSRFYCENHGSKGNFIPSSRVNDGVCDYELCCDGSDEYNGIIVCPDRCEEMALLEEKRKAEKLKIYLKAYPKFQEMLLKAIGNMTEDTANLLLKRRSYAEENEKLTALKDEIKNLEQIEKENKNVYKSLYRELRTKYRTRSDILKGAIEDLFKLKNYRNMTHNELDYILDFYKEETFKEFTIPVVQEDDNDDNGPPKTVEELQKEYEEKELEEEKRLVDEKTKIYNQIRSDLTELRVERSDLDRKIRSIKREMKELEQKLKMDSGKQGIYYSLFGETFVFNTTEYVYTFVWGKEIKQKQIVGGSALTLLGKFKEFRDEYKSIFYDEGAQCWKGPKRSVTINLSCGANNEILKIDEPSKCEYVMIFSTPAVCDLDDLNIIKKNKSGDKKDNPEFSEDTIESIKAMLKESPTQSILDEDDVLGKNNNNNEENKQESDQKHDEL